MIYIGIDVGKKGGFATINKDGITVNPWDDDKFIMVMEVVSGMDECIACVEQVHSMPREGVSASFSFGKSAGFIEGVLRANHIGYQLIQPQRWKKEYSLGKKDKAESIAVCKKLFPNISLLPTAKCTKDSDGMAEALLMAEYARRHF